MTQIIGIDPGSRVTGYGVIHVIQNQLKYVACGCIKTQKTTLPDRLKVIFEELGHIIETYKPDEFAIEQVFMHHNADSALKLGQARGAAICAGVMANLPVAEYTPRQIKQAVVGAGQADKLQVQHMVKIILSLQGDMELDASDALAIAISHAHTSNTLNKMGIVKSRSKRRWR